MDFEEVTDETIVFSSSNQDELQPVTVNIVDDLDTETPEIFFGFLFLLSDDPENLITLNPEETNVTIFDNDGM